MSNPQTEDLRVVRTTQLPSPEEIKSRLPINDEMANLVTTSRQRIADIMGGLSKLLLVVAGPCSVHNTTSALEYIAWLAPLAKRFEKRLLIVPRLCGEKPRTSIGWQGFLSDPRMDESHDIGTAIRSYRTLLLETLRLGLPVACEMLNPTLVAYLTDLVSLGWIGARTVESPTSRELASGLSMPVGFKHTGNGDISTAIAAMLVARKMKTFAGVNRQGRLATIETAGNLDIALIMRGSDKGPNYSTADITKAHEALMAARLNPSLIIDCSHRNCEGNYLNQGNVFRHVIDRIVGGEQHIGGLMLESFIEGGKQEFPRSASMADPNLSVTDACIGTRDTLELLEYAYERLAAAL